MNLINAEFLAPPRSGPGTAYGKPYEPQKGLGYAWMELSSLGKVHSLEYFAVDNTDINCPNNFSNPELGFSQTLFIHPLSPNKEHAVDTREMHDCPSLRKRSFSTQMDCFSQRIYKRRAREASMGILENDQFDGCSPSCPQDRDPGPGLLAFSRSPDGDSLFYKRNINPQNGGNA